MEIKDNGQKLELVVNHQGRNMAEVSLPKVFSAMARRKSLFIKILALLVILGACFPFYRAGKNLAAGSAQAAVLLDHAQTDPKSGLTTGPEAVRFVSSDFAQALALTPLPYKISAANVESGISVEQLLNEESREHLERVEKLVASRTDYARLADKEPLEYDDDFIITLSNGFYDSLSGRTVYLTAEQLSDLLNNVLHAYSARIAGEQNVGAVFTPGLTQSAGGYSLFDTASDALDRLLAYCERMSEVCPQFRADNGMSFADLASAVRSLKTTTLADAAASVFSGLSESDRASAKARYSYLIQAATAELAGLESRIADSSIEIEGYKPERYVVSSSYYKDDIDATVNSDRYNQLVLEYNTLLAERSALKIRIAGLNERLAMAGNASASAGGTDSMSALLNGVQDLEKLAGECADEYIGSGYAGGSLMTVIPASAYDDTLLSFSNIKKAVVFAAAGAIVAVCAWFAVALAEELRKEGAKNA